MVLLFRLDFMRYLYGMEKRLYIFNPESDLALAYGIEGYTAPPHARQLRRDLQMLPAWYCTQGAAILTQEPDTDTAWLGLTSGQMDISARCVTAGELGSHRFTFTPWGWNHELRYRLVDEGACADDIPPREWLDKLRQLSHRSTALRLYSHLRGELDCPMPPEPRQARSVAEILDYESCHPQCYIKAPWSGSGRGIYRVLDRLSPNFIGWASGVLRRQGSVICEHALDRVLDFAMEYHCHNGAARFAGYSVFTTDAHNSFDSGTVAHCEELRQEIAARLGDEELLESVKASAGRFINREIAPVYSGYMGVDMMLYRTAAGETRLNPCVELNLRMTMGAVTALFARHHLADGARGTFRVEYVKNGGVAGKMAALTRRYPLKTVDGKLASGVLPLTPVYPSSSYCAYIQATRQ